jgi:hypothetical protein
LEFAGHDLDSSLIAVQSYNNSPATSLDTRDFDNNGHAQSGKRREILYKRPISFPGADYLLLDKTAPKSFQL